MDIYQKASTDLRDSKTSTIEGLVTGLGCMHAPQHEVAEAGEGPRADALYPSAVGCS